MKRASFFSAKYGFCTRLTHMLIFSGSPVGDTILGVSSELNYKWASHDKNLYVHIKLTLQKVFAHLCSSFLHFIESVKNKTLFTKSIFNFPIQNTYSAWCLINTFFLLKQSRFQESNQAGANPPPEPLIFTNSLRLQCNNSPGFVPAHIRSPERGLALQSEKKKKGYLWFGQWQWPHPLKRYKLRNVIERKL